MRIKFANLSMKDFPDELNSLKESLIADIDDDGIVQRTGFMGNEKNKVFLRPKLINKEDINLIAYREGKIKINYFVGTYIQMNQSVLSQVGDFFLYPNSDNFRTNTSLPYVIALVNNTDYPLTAFCSIAGKVNNEIFNIGLKHLDEAIKSKYTGKFLRLTEKQMIELVNDYIEDNCMVAKMKSDLVESKIIIEHPNNIFNKNDVKILNKKLKLNEKLEIGEWDFLIIQKDDSYLISLNKSSTDVFTLFLVKKDYKELALAVKDISERISKIFYGKIPKGKTKLMNFV